MFGLSATYLPPAISGAAAEYGLIGVAVPVISWLVVLGWLLVLSAILERRTGPGWAGGTGRLTTRTTVRATRDASSRGPR